ncbi:hypothetical protein, partial [Cronobacter sakazakii]
LRKKDLALLQVEAAR